MTVVIDGITQGEAGTFNGDVTITGDLTVQGSTTSTVNQTISGTVEGATAGSWSLLNEAASATNPTILPNKGDTNTGLGQVSSGDQLSLIAGGHSMLFLREHTGFANYVAAIFDAADQVDLTSANSSTWRLIQTSAVTVDWDGGVLVTATDGLAAYLGIVTQTADQATTVTTASTLYVANPVDGTNITITNNYPINTESGAFLTAAGAWTDDPSTMKKKHSICDTTPGEMKQAISRIQGRSWIYNKEWGDAGRTRFGVIAEEQPDFLFGLGTTQRNVTTPSIMAGFALAGIAYHEDRIDALSDRIELLEAAK